tara:strand:- start:94 stop:990 length:897 start_codon:yes stop_codon:yes gene_type:complete
MAEYKPNALEQLFAVLPSLIGQYSQIKLGQDRLKADDQRFKKQMESREEEARLNREFQNTQRKEDQTFRQSILGQTQTFQERLAKDNETFQLKFLGEKTEDAKELQALVKTQLDTWLQQRDYEQKKIEAEVSLPIDVKQTFSQSDDIFIDEGEQLKEVQALQPSLIDKVNKYYQAPQDNPNKQRTIGELLEIRNRLSNPELVDDFRYGEKFNAELGRINSLLEMMGVTGSMLDNPLMAPSLQKYGMPIEADSDQLEAIGLSDQIRKQRELESQRRSYPTNFGSYNSMMNYGRLLGETK